MRPTKERATFSAKTGENTCPLCGGGETAPYHRDKARDYWCCHICGLVFVPPGQHLSAEAEKACYDQHDNRPDDPAYRRFLDRLFTPLNQRLAPNSRGLDFGCGPGPTLSVMFEEAGHRVALYDPFYAPDKSVLAAGSGQPDQPDQYDFITLSEVAEHLAQPGKELDHLWSLLAPGGWLGIMTKRVASPPTIKSLKAFTSWHYINDPTHICFFADATFRWLANRWSATGAPATLTIAGNDVVLLQKRL